MAQLLVRKLDERLVALLKARAERHGRSAEEEHRIILFEALTGLDAKSGEIPFKDYLTAAPAEDVELPLPERHHSSERELTL